MKKRVRATPLLTLHRFEDGGADHGSGLWLDDRLDRRQSGAAASANFDLSYLKIDNTNFKRHRVNPAG
jgi:hypothetical protein